MGHGTAVVKLPSKGFKLKKEKIMEGRLKNGEVLTSEISNSYTVLSLLGSGGQGEVYEVECGGIHYALKWYFPDSATEEQKSILENLINKGAPDKMFLWPLELVKKEEIFGYIMPLRPKNYKSIVDMMKRKAEPSFYYLCKAAYNLVTGFEKLHSAGFSYRDISFGNVFFDPDNGDVLICDNDNAASSTVKCSVRGTPRFMAPEIVRGEADPSHDTDLYSLAVLLFYMFMLSHPLDGKKESEIKCMDTAAMNKIYGSQPIFVYDPTDRSNRPVRGIHDNVIIYWGLYPQELKDLFTQSFTTGLREPNKRVIEKKWLDIIGNMMSCIELCPKCGAEVFFDEAKVLSKKEHTCWNDRTVVKMPVYLAIGKKRVLLHKDTKLFSHHTNSDYDMKKVVGSVVQNPKNPEIWGIRNESEESWEYISADGSHRSVPPGKSAAIANGAKIRFGKDTGEFK